MGFKETQRRVMRSARRAFDRAVTTVRRNKRSERGHRSETDHTTT